MKKINKILTKLVHIVEDGWMDGWMNGWMDSSIGKAQGTGILNNKLKPENYISMNFNN